MHCNCISHVTLCWIDECSHNFRTVLQVQGILDDRLDRGDHPINSDNVLQQLRPFDIIIQQRKCASALDTSGDTVSID